MDELHVRQGSGEPLTMFLGNLWNTLKRQPDARSAETERFINAMLRAAGTSKTAHDRTAIIPMIKDELYLTTNLSNLTGDKRAVTEHLAADLWIVYAFDTPETMLTMQQRQLSDLGLKSAELRMLAIDNLRRILPPVMQHGDGPFFMLTAGSDYVASLLLLDEVWTELQDTIEGNIIAAVPSRDLLFFSSSTSKKGIEKMRSAITRATSSGAYLVSSTMLRRTAGKWEPFS